MAMGSLTYRSMNDGFIYSVQKSGNDSLELLNELKKDFSHLYVCDVACGHDADIYVIEDGEQVFDFEFNNGSWRDKHSLFNRG